MHILGPMMGSCDSFIVEDYIVEELKVIYYHTEEKGLLITHCFDDSTYTGSKIHDKEGDIRYYMGVPENDDYSIPFLEKAEWEGDQLKYYVISGPDSFYQSFSRDENGDIRIIDRTEDSGGYILEMDSLNNTKAKAVYNAEAATITWMHHHNNGILKEKYTHYWPKGQLKVGPYWKYDYDGNLITKGQYLYYDRIKAYGLEEKDVEGYKDGTWFEYQDGETIKQETWEKGILKE